MKKNSIVYLNRSQLEMHPDNPRKNLGDLEELRESIRANGIMQNLTVIPTDDSLEHFRILIGHRRYAASEGILSELPCVIVEGLSDREQVGIMLCENLQRNDLTYYEQGRGFQMMIDLGDTVDQISEKTGFSTTTVRHRLEIAKLRKKLIEEIEKETSWQIGINDYIELEKIKNLKDRTEVLKDSCSSEELKHNVRRYLRDQKQEENKAEVVAVLNSLDCKEIKDSMAYTDKYVLLKLGKEKRTWLNFEDDIDLDDLRTTIEKKKREIKTPIVYQLSYSSVYIGYKKIADKAKKKTKAELEAERKKNNMLALKDARKQICAEFAKCILDIDTDQLRHLETEKSGFKQMIEKLWSICEKAEVSFYYYGLKLDSIDTLAKEAMRPLLEKYSDFHVIQKMMTRILVKLSCKHGISFCDWQNKPNTNTLEAFETFADILYFFGLRLSDDFNKIIEGNSELYEEVDNGN